MKHPDLMPDDMARALADLARAHGYGIETLTLTWLTRDLGHPLTARVTYAPDVIEMPTVDGGIRRVAL